MPVRHMAPARCVSGTRMAGEDGDIIPHRTHPLQVSLLLSFRRSHPTPPSSTWESIHKEPPAPRVHLTHLPSCDELTHTFLGSGSRQQHPGTPGGASGCWCVITRPPHLSVVGGGAGIFLCVRVCGGIFHDFFGKFRGFPQLHESEMQ